MLQFSRARSLIPARPINLQPPSLSILPAIRFVSFRFATSRLALLRAGTHGPSHGTITVGLFSGIPQSSRSYKVYLGFRASGPHDLDTSYLKTLVQRLPEIILVAGLQSCLRVSRVCSSGALARPQVSPLVLLLLLEAINTSCPHAVPLAQHLTLDDDYETPIYSICL
ncbi:hypothetical protein F66182_8090 [Fusarium sp. NRRL 66182]|nr:hypothetical protein F66182_8090 [Fusarium sp. NRRL 66182]